MPSGPLNPFSPPSSLLSHLQGTGSGAFLAWIMGGVFLFWAVYTVVAVYHWMKYSHASWVAFPAILVHLGVSLALITYAFAGAV